MLKTDHNDTEYETTIQMALQESKNCQDRKKKKQTKKREGKKEKRKEKFFLCGRVSDRKDKKRKKAQL